MWALGLVLLAGCAEQGFELREAWPWAELNPISAPPGPLGDDAAGPFRGRGWQALPAAAGDLKSAQEPASLNFYLTQPMDVELTLEASGRGRAELGLNDRPLGPLALTEPWRVHPFQVRARRGQNRLKLQAPPGSRWRALKVGAGGPEPERLANGLRLPFGRAVSFPLNLEPGARLEWRDLRPWLSPGSPPPRQFGLELRLEARRTNQSTTHSGGSGGVELALTGEVALALTARGPRPPLPGQLGVELVEPRLQRGRPPQIETAPPPLQSATASRPHIILYVIDTLRPDRLHCYGYPFPTSPHLDRLAQESVRFRSVVAQSSWTKPATATILTGLAPHQHGAVDFSDQLPDKVETLAERLKAAGYETRALVTNLFVSQAFGFQQGFERFDYQALNALATTEALRGQLRRSDRPLFLYVHTMDPHLPYAPPPGFLPPRFQPRQFTQKDALSLVLQSPSRQQELLKQAGTLYDGEVRASDEALGGLVAILKQAGIYDNSLLIVISDHGEELLEHGWMGHGFHLHREVIQVPLLIRFPQGRWGGTTADGLWQQLDLVPTILAEAGLPQPAELRGLAFEPARDDATTDRPAFFSLRVGREAEKFVAGPTGMMVAEGVRWHSWALHRTLANRQPGLALLSVEPVVLFDLARDPEERENVAYTRPEARLRLDALLRKPNWPMFGSSRASPEDVRKSLESLQYLR